MGIYAPPQLNNFLQDYVVSNCVWTGDALGSTRAASMTAGTVCIAGNFYAVSAVTARTFTASKDTYIDVDSTGTVIYTEVANNAASPALTAGSIRIGIIITGVSTIATAGSVNQGQETMVLPIASSIPYTVTDSLGNLICPRDPLRKLLGYRQITGNITTTATAAAQATGLSCPVIVPSGRKVKVSVYASSCYTNTNGVTAKLTIWDGVVGSGTQIQLSTTGGPTTFNQDSPLVETIVTPATASKTYNAGFHAVSAATTTIEAASTAPAFIKVELA